MHPNEPKPLESYCPVCSRAMNYHKGYGANPVTCSRACHKEFGWRMSLSVHQQDYEPDPDRDRSFDGT